MKIWDCIEKTKQQQQQKKIQLNVFNNLNCTCHMEIKHSSRCSMPI